VGVAQSKTSSLAGRSKTFRTSDGEAARLILAETLYISILGGVKMISRSLRTALFLLLSLATVSAQGPPIETGPFRKPDLVELIKLDPSIKLDIRYATKNNFLGKAVYKQSRAFLQRPAAEALARVNQALRKQGYGLVVFDGYRPWSVTKVFWDVTPADKKIFVADPSKGSRHNRGCAVDLTLYDLKTGKPAEMTGLYDEMSERSYPDYPGGTSLARWHRDLLRRAMEDEGFAVYEVEWWHFDYKDWPKYPILNVKAGAF
jgi:D-alanyl-D-alanine dipeptidase